MSTDGSRRRRPIWPLALIGSFILFVVAGLVIIALRDISEPADPAIVEEHFAEHIAFLKELALACPEITAVPSFVSGDEFDEEAWNGYHAKWDEWSEKSKSRPDLMSHPAVKGAATYVMGEGDGYRAKLILIDNDDLEPSWMEGVWSCLGRDPAEQEGDPPDVRQWREGDNHFVRYEAYFVSPEGVNMGLQLLVDLNLVEREDPAK